jgi:hypothetical protein
VATEMSEASEASARGEASAPTVVETSTASVTSATAKASVVPHPTAALQASAPTSGSAASAGSAPREPADLICAALFALVGGVAVFLAFENIGLTANNEDLWFQADTGRAFGDMVWHDGGHVRTNVHPLFVMTALPAVYAVRKLGHVDPHLAVRVISGVVAGLWLAGLYLLFRLMHLRRWEAVLFGCLSAVAASPMFWFTCPETFPLGSLSIVAVFAFLAATRDRSSSFVAFVLVVLASLSMTVTNGMIGVIAAFAFLSWRRALKVVVCAMLSLFALSAIQKLIFPSARLVGMRSGEESSFFLDPKLGGPLHVSAVFFLHTVIAPALGMSTGRAGEPNLSIQMSAPGSAGLAGALGTGAWIALLAIGVWGLFSSRLPARFRLVLGLSLVGQYLLHLVYGDETFLYSLHFAPLLILIAAVGTQTRARPLVVALLVVLVPLAAVNNYVVFLQAREFARAHSHAAAGARVQHAMRSECPPPGRAMIARPTRPRGSSVEASSCRPGPI